MFPRRVPSPASRHLRAAVSAAARVFAAIALFPGLAALPARAQEPAGSAADGALAVPLDSAEPRPLALFRGETEAADSAVYELTIEIPGRKIPLSARIPFESGQTDAELTLTVAERGGRHVSSLSLPPGPDGSPGALPRLPLGLAGGKPVTVALRRGDASAGAAYAIEAGGNAAAFSLSTNRLVFAPGQAEAAFTVAANRSREELLPLRVANEADPADRLHLSLPVVRSWAAAFENNFYVCFIKKIPFGTREVLVVAADGSVSKRTEQVYKGRWHYITNGLRNTLSVALCAVVLGAVLGFLAAIVRYTHDKHGRLVLLDALAKAYITVIRGTPMTVQLLIAYFIIFSSINNKILVAILAFGFNSGAYVAEIIRAGIMSIDAGQMEAARSLGLSYGQGMRLVVLPQAIRNILPALGNEFIVMLKDTSIASFIGLDDLARGGSIIRSQTYQAYIPFLAVAAIYLVLVMVFSKLLARLERHLRRSSA
jgi:His/Glu/Gln/Arg/opine family amino acid ABC transporter permease subunit